MNKETIDEFVKAIRENDSFGIVSHARPDGDAIGSELGLGLALRAMGKKVTLWNEDGVPRRFAFAEGADTFSPLPGEGDALPQVLICVDTGDRKRLGDTIDAMLDRFPFIINIDHHGTNPNYGHINLVEPEAAACGCVVLQLIHALEVELTPAMATALYIAVSTDTGSFRYSSVTGDVMRRGGELLDCGIDVAGINRRLYEELSPGALRVQREVLNNVVVSEDGTIAHYAMPAGTKERLGVDKEATKDLVDIIRVIEGVLVAIIFEDLEDGRIRVSLRSKDPRIDMCALAQQFGGGGHIMAAGCRVAAELEDCRRRVVAAAQQAVNAL